MKTPEEGTPRCPPDSDPLLSPGAESRTRTPQDRGGPAPPEAPTTTGRCDPGPPPAQSGGGCFPEGMRGRGGHTAAPDSDQDTPTTPPTPLTSSALLATLLSKPLPPSLLWPQVPPRAHVTASHPTGGGPRAATDGVDLPQRSRRFHASRPPAPHGCQTLPTAPRCPPT